ncbi:MAG: Smr/MutS family protein [Oscillospiraceae bacterium]|jgi:hypothetical protein|nr:Smr/MutS family protein [Oscillospiraceae bacterium]
MSGIREVNIKEDMPTVNEAVRRLQDLVPLSKAEGYKVLKIIHGYGSTGQGGAIGQAVRRRCQDYKAKGKVHGVIPGENLSIFDADTRKALQSCPELKKDPAFEQYNRGITFIIL